MKRKFVFNSTYIKQCIHCYQTNGCQWCNYGMIPIEMDKTIKARQKQKKQSE